MLLNVALHMTTENSVYCHESVYCHMSFLEKANASNHFNPIKTGRRGSV